MLQHGNKFSPTVDSNTVISGVCCFRDKIRTDFRAALCV